MADNNNKITLTRLSHVIYQHPDIEKYKSFAKDFGLEVADTQPDKNLVFFRGYGLDQYVYIATQAPAGEGKKFIGAGFTARSREDFDRATRLPGAEVIDISAWPGAGSLVKIRDPNGYEVRILHGQEEQALPKKGISVVDGGRPTLNGAIDKHRKGEFTRMVQSPAAIHKLGHFGYETDNYEGTHAWYTSNFNLEPTDVLHTPGNESLDVATFFHLDLGDEYVDHHCFLLARREKPGTSVHHSSFEVEDMDTQMIGHQWLRDRGYDNVWGIGRHVHGSQLFGYWYDPERFIVEHYADGDVVNGKHEIYRAAAGNMAVWGPPVPAIWGGKQQVSA
ncbi:hypothetical protein PRZ48_006202 [Zasmidium cellare]|uniref:VOC domain-containing protein n=1 Tax=Zasmidium cellare TaxID=395010 RepID=A0ABR0ENQ9_ZASCE|nr:hypothetical protein PRZ48_006202 [Zasmidium cellare]